MTFYMSIGLMILQNHKLETMTKLVMLKVVTIRIHKDSE